MLRCNLTTLPRVTAAFILFFHPIAFYEATAPCAVLSLSLQTQTRRLQEAAARNEHHAYMMEIDANQIIDARFKSNLARFINHRCVLLLVFLPCCRPPDYRRAILSPVMRTSVSPVAAHRIPCSCAPNCELQRWNVQGFTRIGIFATEDIRRGDEITYDYQVRAACKSRRQLILPNALVRGKRAIFICLLAMITFYCCFVR
jgi:hypothetical protein